MNNIELDWKIIEIDGYPENNGNGESNVCIVFGLNKDYILTKYIYEDDEDDNHINYWQDIADHLQHRPKIWAYLPEPSDEIFDKLYKLYRNKVKTN